MKSWKSQILARECKKKVDYDAIFPHKVENFTNMAIAHLLNVERQEQVHDFKTYMDRI